MRPAQNETPFRELSADEQRELVLSGITQNVRDAKTPEERRKAEVLLTRFQEQAKWHFVRELPPLFRLYQHEDGRWWAGLSSGLEAKALSLRAKTHTDKEKEAVAQAVNALGGAAFLPSGTLVADVMAKALSGILHETLLPRLHAITLADPESRVELGEKLKKDLAHAIDQLVTPEGLKPRANATLVQTNDGDGQTADILIEQAAIEGARLLAQQDQALPTKLALREWLEKHHPETISLSPAKWSSLWRGAGLESLPEASAWSRK